MSSSVSHLQLLQQKAQAVHGSCGLSIPGDVQKAPGHSPWQLPLGGPAQAGHLAQVTCRGPSQAILSHAVILVDIVSTLCARCIDLCSVCHFMAFSCSLSQLNPPPPVFPDVMITDQYGNQVQTVTSACVNSLGVSGPGLDKSNVKITWEVCRSYHTVYFMVSFA